MKDLPRICYILGGEDNPLQIDEEFRVGREMYHINREGKMVDSNGFYCDSKICFSVINYPELIERRPKKKQFTDEQKSLLKALLKFGLRFITRDENESLWACDNKAKVKFNTCWYGLNGKILKLPIDLFPQIKWEDEEPFDIKAYLESEASNDD